MTPEEIRTHGFTIRKRRPGYDVAEVDGLLNRAAHALAGLASGRPAVLGLTGPQVRGMRFRESKPGYDRGEVDAYLDTVAIALETAARRSAPLEGARPIPLLSPEAVRAQRFQETKFREGYDMGEVDALLDRAVAALTEATAGRPYQHLLNADDVVAARFRATKFRPGYDQDEVDDFLDKLAAALG
jgi:DivIVA domain-containing protein